MHELVQWGEGGSANKPFARLKDGGGEGDSHFGAAPARAGGDVEIAGLREVERHAARRRGCDSKARVVGCKRRSLLWVEVFQT